MAAPPIQQSATGLDLSPRTFKSTAVAASPQANTETVICTVTCNQNVAVVSGAFIQASCAFLVGASGTDVTLKLRRTDASGTIIFSTGLINTATAADLMTFSLSGFDTGTVMPNQVYCLTLLVTAGGAESTVSAANIFVLVI